jgi:hypothetical protein
MKKGIIYGFVIGLILLSIIMLVDGSIIPTKFAFKIGICWYGFDDVIGSCNNFLFLIFLLVIYLIPFIGALIGWYIEKKAKKN